MTTPAPTDSRPPNILLIMADQLAAQFLPVYGHDIVQAPNIAALAARGMRFDSAYTNSPLCAPSRFAMMTGRRNSDIGAYDNAAELPASTPTFAHHLRASGFQTALCGKMHFVGPDQLHGYEERLTTDIYPADFGWTPNWDAPNERVDWWFHNMDSVRFAGIAEATNQLDYDDEVGFQAVRKLRDLARSGDRRPWHLTVSFTHPHDPYVNRREYWDRYDHAAIDLPRVRPLAADVIDAHSRRLRAVSDMDAPGAQVSDDEIRNARHAYYASISYVDEWVGTLLSTLTACGFDDDTVVVFTADHGDMLGERGLWYKMNFFEPACRIPLLVAGPGIRSGSSGEHVSLVDLLPTFLELAGPGAGPLGGAGVSLLPLCRRGDDPLGPREVHAPAARIVEGEYLGEGAIAPIFMIRDGQWKYVHCDADSPQLYDLVADPDELRNVAASPEHREVAASYSARVGERWNSRRINEEVLASQRQRRVVDAAMRQGRRVSWDHQPMVDASERYMRNHFDLNEVERGRRLR